MTGALRTLALFAVLSTNASAAPLPVTLIWLAPEGCPQQAEVWEYLSERLGRLPSTPDGTSFAVRGEVVKNEAGFQVGVQTLTASGSGSRSFTHPNCEEVTRLAVVALSLAIDPALESPAVETRSLWLGVGPTAAVSLLPLPAAGVTASAGLDLMPVSVHLTVSTSLSQRYVLDDVRALNMGMPISGSLDACVGYFGSRVAISGCGVFTAAFITSVPDGVAFPRTGAAAVVGLGPRARARVVLHTRVAIQASVDGSFALTRPVFIFASGEPAYAVPPVAVTGLLSVEFRIW